MVLIVNRLSIAVVKGMRMSHPDTIQLNRAGVVGDREFCVVDGSAKVVSSPKTGVFLPFDVTFDRAAHRLTFAWEGEILAGPVEAGTRIEVNFHGRSTWGSLVSGPWNEALSQVAGEVMRLVQLPPGGGTDALPVSILGSGSVAELSRRTGELVDSRRFRMNIEFANGEPHEEERWNGERIRVGGSTLEGKGTVPRCAATTRHPETGKRDLSVIKPIRLYRGIQQTELGRGVPFGIYATVAEPGAVSVGDEVRVG